MALRAAALALTLCLLSVVVVLAQDGQNAASPPATPAQEETETQTSGPSPTTAEDIELQPFGGNAATGPSVTRAAGIKTTTPTRKTMNSRPPMKTGAPKKMAVSSNERMSLTCYECSTGSGAQGPLCDNGKNGTFTQVHSATCDEYYNRMRDEGQSLPERSLIRPKCYMTFASMYDSYIKQEYRITSRGCSLSLEGETAAGCTEYAPTSGGGRSIQCFCDDVNLCNSAVRLPIGGAFVLVALLISAFFNVKF